jgi:universal stress protein A
MFQAIPVNENRIVAFKAIGKLNDADFDRFIPTLEKLIADNGPISLLIELEDFRGWEPSAAWTDFKFTTEHDDDFNRIAIIGEKRWEHWMTALGNAFTVTEIRYFKREELLLAWDWLREGLKTEAEGETTAHTTLKPYEHILVATDFSPHADIAVLRAREIAAQYDARITILHAVENFVFYGDLYDPIGSVQQQDTDRMVFEAAEKKMATLAESLEIPNLTTEVLWGTPKATVLSYAAAQQVDLIVTGSHGRSGVSRLLGSTTNGILHGANCDVLSVRID